VKKTLIAAAFCAALTAQAQDDPFASFAELEADAAAAATKKEAGVMGKLIENVSGKTKIQQTHYFNEHTPAAGGDPKDNFWNLSLEFETWTAGDNWRVDASGWMQDGNQNNTFHNTNLSADRFWVDREDQEHRYLTLNELYLTVNFNTWDLILGKKIFKNGLSTIYSPADQLRPVAGIDPIDARDLGIWQARADIYKSDFTYTLAVLPVWQPDKVPDNSSRWVNAKPGAQPTIFPSSCSKNFGYFGRVKTTQSGWDLFASCYVGPGRNYVMQNQGTVLIPKLVRRVPDVFNPAAGYSTTHEAWEFHGEVAYFDAFHDDDQDYISFVQGTTYTIDGDNVKKLGLEQIEITVEGAIEKIVGSQRAAGYVNDSSSVRVGRRDLISRVRFKVNEDLDFEYNSHFQFEKWGYMNRIAGNWEFMNNLTLSVGAEFFGGNKGGGVAGLNNLSVNYGGWKANNRLVTTLEYEF
jgi:hypothetical protein